MKLYNRFSIFAIQLLLVSSFVFFFQNKITAQVQVGVTVTSGNSTTTCTDLFGSADPLWRVRVGTGAWTTFSNNNSESCYTSYPSLEWSFPFYCQAEIPTSIQVCFRAFENDGFFGCDVTESCLEEICQNFIIPSPGNIANYTLALPAGGDSGGEVNFSIGAIGTPFTDLNDEICNAEMMGLLPSGGTLGAASAGGYDNLCATNINDPSPFDTDNLFWINEKGVWFEFTTSATPGYEININALNDPLNLGVSMNIELAVYESDDGTCNGNLTLVNTAFNAAPFDETLTLDCPEPNTTYFILVDGNDFNLEGRGHFGLEIIDNGAIAAPDLRCDAYDLGMIPTGGNAGIFNVHNECASNAGDPNPTAFISQNSVWFYFQAPPSGSVNVEILSVDGAPWNNGIGAQIGVYRSFNNMCTGFFSEVGSSFTNTNNDESLELNCLNPGDNYWILVDGSGSNTAGIFDVVVTDLENYPPEATLDPVICFGDSYQVGNAIYTSSGNYTYVFNLFNGCDSTVYTNLIVADSLDANAEQVTLASSPTAANGSVTANPIGGTPPFSYLWSNGVTTQLNENIPVGNYCVTVTDAVGCEAIDCVDLEYSLISVTATDGNLICFGDTDGNISFFVENGTAPYTYTYTNTLATITGNGIVNADGEIITITNLPADDYQINIEDTDGNTTMTTASVIEPAEIATVQDITLCFGKSIVIGNTTYNTSGAIAETLQSINGCDSIVTGMLVILPDPSFFIDSMICFGENIMVANSTYSSTGIYSDTLLNADGCDSIITTNLTVLDEITVTINITNLPSGYNQADGSAQVQAMGGAGGFTYLWSDGQTTSSRNNLLGGTEYCVTVTDLNGCTREVCNTILYEPNIAIALNDTLNCFGNTDGTITLAAANGLGNYNFIWENTNTGMTGNGIIVGNIGSTIISNLEKGSYVITVTDSYVSTTINVAVIEPSLLVAQSLTAQGTSCVGSCDGSVVITPSGGTMPYSYAWSGGIAPVQEPTNLCATDYTVTVTDTKGCTATSLISIEEPTPFSVTIEEIESISCGGESDGALFANPLGGTGTSFQYLWNNNNITNINNELNTGAYLVTVTDESGCTTTATYNLNEPTPVDFDLNIMDVDCWTGLNSGGILVENITGGTPPYVYSFGQNGYGQIPSFSQIVAGSYQVNVQDANGCVTNQVAIVSLPEEINVTLGDDHEIHLGETVELEVLTASNNALIEWKNLDSCQNCPTLELTPIHTNIYTVNVLDTITGCTDTDNVWIYVSKDRKVFIPNAFSPNEDGMNDYLTVFADSKSVEAIRDFRIFNRWGALVFERKELRANVEIEGWDGFYNNQQMQMGVYIYTVEIEFIDGETELFKGSVTLTK